MYSTRMQIVVISTLKKHSLKPMSTYRRSIFAFRGHKKDFYNTQEKYLLYWMLMALLMHSSL